MVLEQDTPLTACGAPLDVSPSAFGELRRVDPMDGARLRARLEEDGYLYIPGFYDRDEVLAARQELTGFLAAEGALDPDHPALDAVAKAGLEMTFRADLGNSSRALSALIYSDRVLKLYEGLLGGEVRHYDYTWLRAVAPGFGTDPHLDIVFMGRGTPNVMTAWTPLGDIDLRVGGLLVLEGSHRATDLRRTYGSLDVDALCSNTEGQNLTGARGFMRSGAITRDAAGLREELGGRWLTSEFAMGDLLTFGMFTVHASLDNRSRQIRLSSDSRYQLASEPVDERWIGEHPIAHGPQAKRRTIC